LLFSFIPFFPLEGSRVVSSPRYSPALSPPCPSLSRSSDLCIVEFHPPCFSAPCICFFPPQMSVLLGNPTAEMGPHLIAVLQHKLTGKTLLWTYIAHFSESRRTRRQSRTDPVTAAPCPPQHREDNSPWRLFPPVPPRESSLPQILIIYLALESTQENPL